jgi:hypothetical protein
MVITAFGAGLTSLPARADEAALQQRIDALESRLAQLEKELADSKKASATPPAPAATASALAVKNGSKLTVSGFAETRMTNIANPIGDHIKGTDVDFQVTRFRPRFIYTMDPHFQAQVQLNASTRSAAAASVNARDVFLEYGNPGLDLKMGQTKIPFGYQVFREGDEFRAGLERARVMGVLFPDERDIGLVASTTSKNAAAPIFAAGVMNGDGINHTDPNHGKAIAANALYPINKNAVIGGSVYFGSTSVALAAPATGTRDLDKHAYGLENRLTFGRFSTQAEYVWGRLAGHNLNGGYGQLQYNLGKTGNVYVRHDVFDPDDKAVHDYWHNTSLGWYRDFTKQFRLTAEYNLVRNEASTLASGNNTFGIEAQANF